MLPIVRTFISLPAGAARMPFWRFTALTLAGCIPWVLMLALIGRAVGDNWEEWRDYLHYLDYPIILAMIGAAIWLFVRWRGDSGTETDTDSDGDGGAEPAETTL